jgi:hypothetical protein
MHIAGLRRRNLENDFQQVKKLDGMILLVLSYISGGCVMKK